MSPVTLMTHPHLLSLLLSLNEVLLSNLPMALGNFAHDYGQSCSSLWVNLPIVVGKLHSCTFIISHARTLLLYILNFRKWGTSVILAFHIFKRN